jgi:hypothetical protein
MKNKQSKSKTGTSPERLVLALIEHGEFEQALVLVDNLLSTEATKNSTVYLYTKALALFASNKREDPEKKDEQQNQANNYLHQAFASNNLVLPLMVERINTLPRVLKKNEKPRKRLPQNPQQLEAAKYVSVWFGSWLQTENAFDWLGNEFVEWTKATKLERIKAQQEKMLANSKKLDIDFFLN